MNFVERSLSDVTKQKMKEMKMKLKRYDSSTIELDEIDPEPSENNPTIQEFINVFSQEINYTIRPNLSEEETTEVQQTLLVYFFSFLFIYFFLNFNFNFNLYLYFGFVINPFFFFPFFFFSSSEFRNLLRGIWTLWKKDMNNKFIN